MTIEDYINAIFLAQDIESKLLSQLQIMQIDLNKIVDVGCGVGTLIQALHARSPKAVLFGLDSDELRLTYAKKKHPQANWLSIHNTENLPFDDQSIDLIISNLYLAWQTNLEKTLTEWRRVLKPNGLLMFSTLGPDSLNEISEHRLHLVDMHDIGDLLLKLGFEDPVLEVEMISVNYKDLKKMRHELIVSDMIAPNATLNAACPLTLTYETICGHAWRPRQTSYAADETGVVKIPLSHLKRS